MCLFCSRRERICWTEGQDKVQRLMQQLVPVVGDTGSKSGLALSACRQGCGHQGIPWIPMPALVRTAAL